MGKQRNRAQKGDHIFIIEDKKNDKISGQWAKGSILALDVNLSEGDGGEMRKEITDAPGGFSRNRISHLPHFINWRKKLKFSVQLT